MPNALLFPPLVKAVRRKIVGSSKVMPSSVNLTITSTAASSSTDCTAAIVIFGGKSSGASPQVPDSGGHESVTTGAETPNESRTSATMPSNVTITNPIRGVADEASWTVTTSSV